MKKLINTEFWNGQLFELIGPDSKESFFTQLIQHHHDLLVQRPRNQKNITMTMESGMPVTVYFHDDFNGLCTFDTKIHQFDNGKTLLNKPSANSIKIAQRRRFFRVQVAVEMRLFLYTTKNSNVEKLTAFTHDISGGGVSFLYPQIVVEEGSVLKGILHLITDTTQQRVEFNGRVVRVLKQENQTYKTSLQFIEMKDAVRSEIIRFCMFKQIELRNKVIGNSFD